MVLLYNDVGKVIGSSITTILATIFIIIHVIIVEKKVASTCFYYFIMNIRIHFNYKLIYIFIFIHAV